MQSCNYIVSFLQQYNVIQLQIKCETIVYTEELRVQLLGSCTNMHSFMLGPVPNVLLIVLHVKQVPMLLFVLYNMLKALVYRDISLNN